MLPSHFIVDEHMTSILKCIDRKLMRVHHILTDFMHGHVLFFSYSIKAFAVLLSSFEEVLWLDTDNTPIMDPEFLFHVPVYIKQHAIFWPDACNFHTVRAAAYDVMGLPRPGM